MIGIDEAGRGPVIGPLVMAGVFIEDDSGLIAMGVKDSKLLSPLKREQLFDKIKELPHFIISIPAEQVDAALNDPNLNLNKLELITAAKIINELPGKVAMLDAPGSNISAMIEYTQQFITRDIDLKAEHKADLNYPVVGAASILAKVTRDREIERMKREIQIDFGSGYPSDPKTVKFLKENHDKYDIFRKTWSSWKKIAMSQNQGTLGKY